jgi:hypothetical protein
MGGLGSVIQPPICADMCGSREECRLHGCLMANGAARADTSQHHADGSALLTYIGDVLTRPDTRRYRTVRLITRRSQVQILPPLRRKPLAFLHVPRVFSRLEHATFSIRMPFSSRLHAILAVSSEKKSEKPCRADSIFRDTMGREAEEADSEEVPGR